MLVRLHTAAGAEVAERHLHRVEGTRVELPQVRVRGHCRVAVVPIVCTSAATKFRIATGSSGLVELLEGLDKSLLGKTDLAGKFDRTARLVRDEIGRAHV